MTKNIGSNLLSQVEGNELKGPRASYSNMRNCYPCYENRGLHDTPVVRIKGYMPIILVIMEAGMPPHYRSIMS